MNSSAVVKCRCVRFILVQSFYECVQEFEDTIDHHIYPVMQKNCPIAQCHFRAYSTLNTNKADLCEYLNRQSDFNLDMSFTTVVSMIENMVTIGENHKYDTFCLNWKKTGKKPYRPLRTFEQKPCSLFSLLSQE